MLLLLQARAMRRGLPPPAALIGDWYSSRAVLVPSVHLAPAAGFAVPTKVSEHDAAAGVIGGGWVGYLGYGLTDPSRRPGALPDAVCGWTDRVLRLDAGGQWWFEAITDASGELADEYKRLLLSPDPPPRAGWSASPLRRPARSQHEQAVRRCIEAIEAGELFQANICARFHGTFDGCPAELFAAGARRLLARRSAYLAGEWGAVVSFSPELFLSRHGDRVRSTPIKGTLPRRGGADDLNAGRLRRSAKDVAENVMITDLVRDDLGRVSTASVTLGR